MGIAGRNFHAAPLCGTRLGVILVILVTSLVCFSWQGIAFLGLMVYPR
jgi:hypothetical protein